MFDILSEYKIKFIKLPKNKQVADFPLHLDIETSSDCNLECTLCPRTIRDRPSSNMTMETFKKIIDQANGVYAVNLNFLGEPLLNPLLHDMVKYAKDKGIIDVFFHTNGLLLTKERIQKLIDAGLDKIVISIDSPYPDTYEKIRKGSSFSQVIENIKILNRLRKDRPITRINMIKRPGITEEEIEDAKALFSTLADSYEFLNFLEPTRNKINYINKSSICPQILTRLTIWANGDVYPCCMDYDGNMYLGNINNNTIKQIWNSKYLKKLRKIHIKGNYHDIPSCNNCQYDPKQRNTLL